MAKRIPDRIEIRSNVSNPSRADVISYFDHGKQLKFVTDVGLVALTAFSIGWESGLGASASKFSITGNIAIDGFDTATINLYYDSSDRHGVFTRRP